MYISFLLSLSGHSIVSFADEPVNYGYDKVNNVIYAQKNGKKGLLNFTEDYTGNPSYSFDFFQILQQLLLTVDHCMILLSMQLWGIVTINSLSIACTQISKAKKWDYS